MRQFSWHVKLEINSSHIHFSRNQFQSCCCCCCCCCCYLFYWIFSNSIIFNNVFS
jgi:hypothetical protein